MRVTARRIHDDTERSSASAATLTGSGARGGSRTGTGSVINPLRRLDAPCEIWLSALLWNS